MGSQGMCKSFLLSFLSFTGFFAMGIQDYALGLMLIGLAISVLANMMLDENENCNNSCDCD